MSGLCVKLSAAVQTRLPGVCVAAALVATAPAVPGTLPGTTPGAGRAAHAQGTLERTPNLHGGWIGDGGVVRFNVVHRFSHSGPPSRQVTSHPTFLLAYAAGGMLGGVQYATRSDVQAGVPNEWEPFIRLPVLRAGGSLAAVFTATVAWNHAARAADLEAAASFRRGRLAALLAARLLGGTDDDAATAVLGGGVAITLTEHVALAGDLATAAATDLRPAWGAALQLRIPYSPHTLSLHATNTNSATTRGSSRGDRRVRYGFEFTIPVTLSRYFGSRATARTVPPPDEAGARGVYATATGDDVVVVRMHNLRYAADTLVIAPGTVVEWRNEDPLPHTATADNGGWDSGEVAPGAAWRRRFDEPGRFPYHCTPHPFMRGVIIVR
jgi:plastocyanin